MDDSGVDSMQKLGVVGLHPLRRQASDTNLATTSDYPRRAGAKSGVQPLPAGGATKRSKSPFSIFRRPKTQDQSMMRSGDMQAGDSLPMHITVSLTTYNCTCGEVTSRNPWSRHDRHFVGYMVLVYIFGILLVVGGSVAEWLACWTQVQ